MDTGSLGQGPPVCCGLQLTSSSSHQCAGAGMPASCLGGFGSLYTCTCQSCKLCKGWWGKKPAAWHARTQSEGTAIISHLSYEMDSGVNMSLPSLSYQLFEGELQLSQSAPPTKPYWVFVPPDRMFYLAIIFIHRWTHETL